MIGSIRERVDAAGARKRTNAPKSVVHGRFAFTGTITDNATTAADLTASGALKSRAITDRLGVTLLATADPTVVVVIERMAIVLELGVETDLIALDLMSELYLKHSPTGDEPVSIDLFSYYGSPFDGRNGVIATGGFGAGLKKVETFELVDSPLVVNCGSDGLIVAPDTAVNSGGNVPFTLWVDGYAFHNRDYDRAKWVDELPNNGTDIFQIQEERARANAHRIRRYGADKDAVFMSGVELDANRRPRLLRKRKAA